MAVTSTRNVKLGVCRAYYNGSDLGLTQGGVEVSVSTETHKVEIDQFGKSPVNEYVMGRALSVKIPMAETTVDNMARIMPGATLTIVGGAQATGTVVFSGIPSNGDTVTVNGAVFTFKTTPVGTYDIALGASANGAATNLQAALAGSVDPSVAVATYTVNTATVTATFQDKGTVGNNFTLAKSGANIAVSGATLTGGTEPTSKYVEVNSGVGSDLLANAKELRLHPVSRPLTDKTDDFVIPLAGTGGALQFAYKLDQERVFNVEFLGYPDPQSGLLYFVGNKY